MNFNKTRIIIFVLTIIIIFITVIPIITIGPSMKIMELINIQTLNQWVASSRIFSEV